MPKTQTKKIKKGKLQMFLFFLFLATFIWFLTKFSKEFTTTFEAPIVYVNIPNNTALAKNNAENIHFDLTGNGFDLLFSKFKNPIIKIDVSKYYDNNLHIKISNNDLIKKITDLFNSKILVKNLSVNNMTIVLDAINSKIIPVTLHEDIKYKSGYKRVGKFYIKPDSITISGPTNSIDTIVEAKTALIKLLDVDANFTEEVALNILINEKVSYSNTMVSVSAVVEEFTQKSLTIPIKIINLPNNISIKLLPTMTMITYDISVAEFNAYSEKDFIIICDFEKRNDVDNFMIPEFYKKPDGIKNIDIKENKINYLIFK